MLKESPRRRFPGPAVFPKRKSVRTHPISGEVDFMVLSPAVSAVATLLGMAAVFVWRVREGRTAVTLRKIVIPPLGMATGFSMFVVPGFRVPLVWALSAFLIGAIVLAWPLLATSRLERSGDAIMMKRSGAFFAVVLVLAAIRFAARSYVDQFLTVQQTAGLFFVLAFGMILRWRLSMLLAYRALTALPPLVAEAAD
jgi:membrane protein CcdC involved in cytochrome C biogenesis